MLTEKTTGACERGNCFHLLSLCVTDGEIRDCQKSLGLQLQCLMILVYTRKMNHSVRGWKAQMKVKSTSEILYHLRHPLSLPKAEEYSHFTCIADGKSLRPAEIR